MHARNNSINMFSEFSFSKEQHLYLYVSASITSFRGTELYIDIGSKNRIGDNTPTACQPQV
jgi:hypothetical protein